jgi:GNAT superfamily N-acetyltransferase
MSRAAVRDPAPAELGAVVGLVLHRCAHLNRALVEPPVVDAATQQRALLVAGPPGNPLGAALQFHPSGLPEQLRWRLVVVAGEALGTGLGSRLHRALEASSPAGTVASAEIDDTDEHALEVAHHWGYRTTQHSVTVRLDLADVAAPTLPEGYTADISPRLDFPDESAVEAMHDASQTNPERDQHGPATLASLRAYASESGGVAPVGVVLREDGRPVAISYAIVAGEEAQVVYTGVDPPARGRGLAALAKKVLHVEAARAGAAYALTDNEDDNAGIRRVNELLGYRRVAGRFWVRKDDHA